MLINELGVATTLLLGASFGFVGFAILLFWITTFFEPFDTDSKYFWLAFWIHQIIWMVGVCIVPSDWLNDHFKVWAIPFMIFYFGSLIVMAVVKIFRAK